MSKMSNEYNIGVENRFGYLMEGNASPAHAQEGDGWQTKTKKRGNKKGGEPPRIETAPVVAQVETSAQSQASVAEMDDKASDYAWKGGNAEPMDVAGKKKRGKVPSSPASSLAMASELEEKLNHDATSCADAASRLRLWKEWLKNIEKSKAPGAPRYQDDCGRALTYKQVFLQSKALEGTLDSCFDMPLPPSSEADLQVLLTCALPGPAGNEGQIMASLVVQIVASMAGEPVSLVQIAKKSLRSSITSLKVFGEDIPENTIAEITKINEKSAVVEARLNQLPASGETVKQQEERARYTADLLSLCEARVRLLSSMGGSDGLGALVDGVGTVAAPTPSAASHHLKSLGSAIQERQECVRDAAEAMEGKKVELSEAHARMLDKLRAQEEQLNLDALSIKRQIKEAEAHLAMLHVAAEEISAKRAAVADQRRQSLESYSERSYDVRKKSKAAVGDARKYEQQIAVVQSLEQLLASHRQSVLAQQSEHYALVRDTVEQAPQRYLATLDQHLATLEQAQQNIIKGLGFVAGKLAPMQAERAELEHRGLKDLAAQLGKPIEQLLKMLKDRQAESEALVAKVRTLQSSFESHVRSLGLMGHSNNTAAVSRINHKFRQIHVDYNSILSMIQNASQAGPPPHPPAPKPAASRPATAPPAAAASTSTRQVDQTPAAAPAAPRAHHEAAPAVAVPLDRAVPPVIVPLVRQLSGSPNPGTTPANTPTPTPLNKRQRNRSAASRGLKGAGEEEQGAGAAAPSAPDMAAAAAAAAAALRIGSASSGAEESAAASSKGGKGQKGPKGAAADTAAKATQPTSAPAGPPGGGKEGKKGKKEGKGGAGEGGAGAQQKEGKGGAEAAPGTTPMSASEQRLALLEAKLNAMEADLRAKDGEIQRLRSAQSAASPPPAVSKAEPLVAKLTLLKLARHAGVPLALKDPGDDDSSPRTPNSSPSHSPRPHSPGPSPLSPRAHVAAVESKPSPFGSAPRSPPAQADAPQPAPSKQAGADAGGKGKAVAAAAAVAANPRSPAVGPKANGMPHPAAAPAQATAAVAAAAAAAAAAAPAPAAPKPTKSWGLVEKPPVTSLREVLDDDKPLPKRAGGRSRRAEGGAPSGSSSGAGASSSSTGDAQE